MDGVSDYDSSKYLKNKKFSHLGEVQLSSELEKILYVY